MKAHTYPSNALYTSLVLTATVVFIARAVQVSSAHVRFLASMNLGKDQQQYWTKNHPVWTKIKKNLFVAPLINKRHNREFQLSSAIGIGTLPSRLHTLFLSFYILSNVLYCCLLDYHNQTKAALLAEARGRTGHLAVMNMLPLFLFAARNNPLISLLGVSFDTFNLFHRWIGRIVVLESLAHTFIWGVNNYDARGFNGLTNHLRYDNFLLYGLIATCAMSCIIFQSLSFVRHAFYETFLHVHQFLAISVVAGILLHLTSQKLPQISFMWFLVALWALERFIRICRLLARSDTILEVEALDGEACRLTYRFRGSWTRTPGHHIYAYIPSVSLWMSHPFSVAWVDHHDTKRLISNSPLWNHALSETKTLTCSSSIEALDGDFAPLPKRRDKAAISCVVAARSGMTGALYKRACASPSRRLFLKAFVEGPYGGNSTSRSYGTVLLFAGGAGITHQTSILKDVVSAFADGTCVTRRIILAWSVRSLEQLEWIRPWVKEITNMPRRGNFLSIRFYVSRRCLGEDDEMTRKETGLWKHVTFGRMNVENVVEEEFRERVGAMSIGVCGPGGLADDVRAAARGVMDYGNVDFWEESFTW